MGTELIKKGVFRLFLLVIIFFITDESFAQDCSRCNNYPTRKLKTYSISNLGRPNEAHNLTWEPNGNPRADEIVVFDSFTPVTWEAEGGATTTITISGLRLQNNVNVSLGRSNTGNHPAFALVGGCIIIESGSTLTLRYISEMKNVEICVKSGGTLIFDAERSDRNTFSFEGVSINLEDNTSKINFGNAKIDLRGDNNIITGYTGTGCADNNGNITATNPSTVSQFCNFIALPVEWLYINSNFNSIDRSTTINWATAKEWENSHFEIERSINGISNWQKIGEVQGMGWTDEVTEYSFCDEQLPLGGGNVFYRLKQVDFNLQFEYSKTVSVRVPVMLVTKGNWRVYPNPVIDETFRISRTEMEEIASISVRVVSGTTQHRSVKVANEQELTEVVKKEFAHLPKGMFLVEVHWNGKVEYLKILKN